MSGIDIRAEILTPELPPVVPGRLREPLVHVVDNAMPGTWCRDVGGWLYLNRKQLVAHRAGEWRSAADLVDFGDQAREMTAPLRAMLLRELPMALGPCGVADFDLQGVELCATLYHHRGLCDWSDGIAEGEAHRRIGFELTLCTDPKMFTGGELEFLDGTVIAPENGRLVWTHPIQARAVREVECPSHAMLHGRWSVWGWLHGPVPDGWHDIVGRWRCT